MDWTNLLYYIWLSVTLTLELTTKCLIIWYWLMMLNICVKLYYNPAIFFSLSHLTLNFVQASSFLLTAYRLLMVNFLSSYMKFLLLMNKLWAGHMCPRLWQACKNKNRIQIISLTFPKYALLSDFVRFKLTFKLPLVTRKASWVGKPRLFPGVISVTLTTPRSSSSLLCALEKKKKNIY